MKIRGKEKEEEKRFWNAHKKTDSGSDET